MNSKRLKGKISEIGISFSFIARKLGISRQAFYLKLNGRIPFKKSEIEEIIKILRLTDEEKQDFL